MVIRRVCVCVCSLPQSNYRIMHMHFFFLWICLGVVYLVFLCAFDFIFLFYVIFLRSVFFCKLLLLSVGTKKKNRWNQWTFMEIHFAWAFKFKWGEVPGGKLYFRRRTLNDFFSFSKAKKKKKKIFFHFWCSHVCFHI